MSHKNGNHKPDIRIGTLVSAGMKSAEYIRQILPYGFESFSLTFWQTTKGIDWKKLAAEVNDILAGSGAVVSSLGVFGNPLETEPKDKETLQGLKEAIDNAHLFGCDIVAGFTGRLRNRPIDESLPRFKQVWTALAGRAKDNGVRIAFENCDMGGSWQTGDWNIAHNPAAWEMMFHAVPFGHLGLEWEPCHQLVNLIDPMPQLREWVKKIFHLHGKDATIYWDRIRKYGIRTSVHEDIVRKTGSQGAKPFAYHRTPGFGDSDWTAIISELRMAGFKGSIDIEGWHDPVMKGELEMSGQVAALRYLKQCRSDFIPNPQV
ncbi:MAG: sugar phosphate isomerase/epimerase [Verrucomicrobia bacterium]|nr:sugar phosphate isomerase/epimerase [Verrucomicrobiota bacterium]MCG2681718.1 sugar phosphate isomerase/epimerase [Kiritimatiellia bacterium]MBU4247179.1 sugar phosphate isomerase/epimerase [Verrucomicrobiota bacterium]MBU4291398.1 sugar phosphate isomerase/epimerase [Verrucomicrobiota bacterium]MBU4428566.1 sugar phosphate isomerase/epimerase [Verrucomicrobiota bacterium]